MKPSTRLSIGGFLLGLGIGWYIFRIFAVSYTIFAWILIIVGISIVASTIVSWWEPRIPIRGLVGALSGGLILSLFLTAGFGFIWDVTDPLSYKVEDSKSYSGIVTTDRIYLKIENINGPVYLSNWDKSEYSVTLEIEARGSSKNNAEKNLNNFKIDFDQSVLQDQERLILKYDVPVSAKSRYSVEVNVFLPANVLKDLDLSSSNGGIFLSNIEGENINILTSNAPIVFDNIFARDIVGRTSNGRINGKLEAQSTQLSTSNSKIDLTLPCTLSGLYNLSTSNGAIDLKVSSSSNVGYDFDLSTSNGLITIDISGLEYDQYENTRKKAETKGFSDKSIQIVIETITSNSDIDVDLISDQFSQ